MPLQKEAFDEALRKDKRIGIIVGLASEAKVAEDLLAGLSPSFPKPMIAIAGASSRRARSQAHKLMNEGAEALLSFGLAGGLDPSLRVGDLVIGTALFTPSHHLLPMDELWGRRIAKAAAERGIELKSGAIAGQDWAVTRPAMKNWLHYISGGAQLVDMESHTIAEAAWERKVPFLTLRAVVDDAATALPAIVHGSIAQSGRPRTALIALRLLLSPWNYGKLRQLEQTSQRAHKALESLAPLADVLFRGPF